MRLKWLSETETWNSETVKQWNSETMKQWNSETVKLLSNHAWSFEAWGYVVSKTRTRSIFLSTNETPVV